MDSIKEQNAALAQENKELRAKNQCLNDEIKGLKDQLRERIPTAEKNVVHQMLDEFEEHFISFLCHVKLEDCTALKISRAMSELLKEEVSLTKAEVYLVRLEKLGMASRQFNLGGRPALWYLSLRGKEYAVLHGLDKRK